MPTPVAPDENETSLELNHGLAAFAAIIFAPGIRAFCRYDSHDPTLTSLRSLGHACDRNFGVMPVQMQEIFAGSGVELGKICLGSRNV